VRVLVAGSINIETTVPVEGFPIPYAPARFAAGIVSAVSGVGWNVARALHSLGSEVVFLGLAGPDAAGRLVRDEVARSGITAVVEGTPATPQSVIL
jgi:sugar/nucleoside kinase (ribokinase family)